MALLYLSNITCTLDFSRNRFQIGINPCSDEKYRSERPARR